MCLLEEKEKRKSMKLTQKLKSLFGRQAADKKPKLSEAERLALLERNFLVLLKRVLEMDGIKLTPNKVKDFSSKVIYTTNDDIQLKATHESEPTIH